MRKVPWWKSKSCVRQNNLDQIYDKMKVRENKQNPPKKKIKMC